ncbi:MAG: D-aminoacyl-tRNA deacylase [Polyangia bacterium]|jgi:D-tyrosyl-tRNA(Tyr) deacylase|nr:D-aminoacyl-tRNA deacylase [Polyangia bacterium]
MRAVVQRVERAEVRVGQEQVGRIAGGLLVLLGVGEGDSAEDLEYLVQKVIHLRVFEDEQGAMNRSLLEVGGELLVVSQFTLYGDCRKGRRPSFIKAMAPEPAEALCQAFVERSRELGVGHVAQGRFGAMMDVELLNQGPVTLLIDSRKVF